LADIEWFMTKEMDSTMKDLVLGALREGFRTSFEELIKSSGPVDVLAAMKPHMMVIYGSYFDGIKKAMQIKGDGPEALLTVWQAGQEFVIPSDKLEAEITELGGVGIAHQCPFSNSIPEICVYMSHMGTEAVCGLVNPEYECLFTHHMTNGDPYCRYIFKKKTQHLNNPNDLGRTIVKLPELKIPEVHLFAMQLGGITMQWNGVTSAYVQMNGAEKARSVLIPNAHKIGEETGRKIKEMIPTAGQNAETLGQLATSLTKVLNQKGTSTFISDKEFVRQITDCSCQTFSPEFCVQLGSLMDGIVQVLNPEYEFRYDRMITQGDRTCHWAIRKKSIAGPYPGESAVELLKKRLVKGEINEAEYKKLKQLIDG